MTAANSSDSAVDAMLERLFLSARTHVAWLDRPVDDALLRKLYAAARMGPTAANSVPGRFVFVKSREAKKRLEPALAAGNVDKTMAAPVTVIVAVDEAFHEQMPKLFPSRPQMRDSMAGMPADKREFMLTQNGSLQAGYLITAARALGLDCGPMGGFDRAAVDRIFFEGSRWRSILLINLGYGDPEKLHPRLPRLSFEEACRIE